MPIEWRRSFSFVLQPRVFLYIILPVAATLSYFDPLGVSYRLENLVPKDPDQNGKRSGRLAGFPRPENAVTPQLPVRNANITSTRSSRKYHSTSQLRSKFEPHPQRPDTKPPLKVLGIESSADDSCAAIVTSSREILSNVVIKQHLLNAKYGGIQPIEAMRAHMANVPTAIAQAFKEANLGLDDMDAIAYTRGPGMVGCLTVCSTAAKTLAAATGKPVVGIHHMQAHALTPLLTEPEPPAFPFMILLASGGHTQLVLAEAVDKYEIIADTLDMKIGDAFDKAARLLDLPPDPHRNPGAILEHYASLPPLPPHDAYPLEPLPIPLSTGYRVKDLSFSFSGLLAATGRLPARLEIQRLLRMEDEGDEEKIKARRGQVARVFQDAAIGHVAQKVGLAMRMERFKDVRGLVVSGGVASNGLLRLRLRETLDSLSRIEPVKLYFPPLALCTDNGAMIAWTAILRLQAGLKSEPYDLPLRPKWSLADLYDDVVS